MRREPLVFQDQVRKARLGCNNEHNECIDSTGIGKWTTPHCIDEQVKECGKVRAISKYILEKIGLPCGAMVDTTLPTHRRMIVLLPFLHDCAVALLRDDLVDSEFEFFSCREFGCVTGLVDFD